MCIRDSHYYIMAMAGTFFAAIVGAHALDSYAKGAGAGMARWVGATWVLVAILWVSPRFSDEWEKHSAYATPPPPVSQSEVDFVRAHSSPGDRIFTLGDPLL